MNSYEIPISVLTSQALTAGGLTRRRRAALRDGLRSLQRPLTKLERQAMEAAGIDAAEVAQ
jgi:hypothetical protein